MTTISPPSKLSRLDAQIRVEADPVKRGCLRGERAGLLARQGQFDSAREALDSLQRDFRLQPDAGVSVWMQIAEGWMSHYSDRPAAAKDHLKRAYALSTAANLNHLKALSAAWLAHLSYSKNQFLEMSTSLQTAIDNVPLDFHLAQSRLNLVIALAYHFARRLDLAIPWYKRCRAHAFADGDDGTISALSFNMAGLQGNHAIQAAVFGGHVGEYAGLALRGADSSLNFDQLAKMTSRNKWVYIVQAYTLSAAGEYEQAYRLYTENLEEACLQGLQHQRAFFVADRAWCLCQLQLSDNARVDVNEAITLISDDMYVEDRAVAYGRLAQSFEVLGDSKQSANYKALAVADWQTHEVVRGELLELLQSLRMQRLETW